MDVEVTRDESCMALEVTWQRWCVWIHTRLTEKLGHDGVIENLAIRNGSTKNRFTRRKPINISV